MRPYGYATIVLLAIALGVALGRHAPAPAADDAERIERLYAAGSSGVDVRGSGTVDRVLPDDERGARHQRFIVRLASGHTVLVSHNVDLAPRVAPLREGWEVSFRGRYEWNERGGVVHWTHRDPGGRWPGGWIRVGEREFR